MKPPERHDISALIASPCLIQKDRAGRALFISDFARRMNDPDAARKRLELAGYTCCEEDGLTLIDWTPERYAAWYEALPDTPLPALSDENAPLWGLCRILRQHPSPIAAQDITVLSQALRWALLNHQDKILSLLRASLAEALREGKAPPYHASNLLSLYISGQREHSIGR